VTEVVLDASVVGKWWRELSERNVAEARALRSSFEAGEILVVVPSFLLLELINVAGRRWGWSEPALLELAESLNAQGFELREPNLVEVSRWTARGLTAYDACYVALAEELGIDLITSDDQILTMAPGIARPWSSGCSLRAPGSRRTAL
jgi:predicted nucleic acid-binding protein